MSRVPPLNALRAFEAAARLGSFTRAGKELGVTSAAVGQQIRGLEARLGAPLFYRSVEGLTLTAQAGQALPDIRRGFDHLVQGYQRLMPTAGQGRIAISIAPTFAMKWLIPRLHRFYESHPTIEVKFDTAMRFADVGRGEVDLAIRFGSGRYHGLSSDRLLGEWVLPLCAPLLCTGKHGLRRPKDLDRFVLLHLQDETADRSWLSWPGWAENHGLSGARFQEGPRFNQSAMALQAAVEGQGVALCGITYAIDDVHSGRLCAPFGTDSAIQTQYGYDIVVAPARAEHPVILAFRKWLECEVKLSQKRIAEYMVV